MKKNLYRLVIAVSVVLIIGNFIFFEGFDRGFWMTTISSMLVIFSMMLTIRENNKKDKK